MKQVACRQIKVAAKWGPERNKKDAERPLPTYLTGISHINAVKIATVIHERMG